VDDHKSHYLHITNPFLGVCEACRADAQNTVIALMNRIRRAEGRLQATHTACTSCTSSVNVETIECVSLDCPWLFARKKAEVKVDLVTHLRELLSEMEDLINEDEDWC
jgi:DNA polymerase zeta